MGADAYGFGPALWVAPVLERGAVERSVELPRGEWIDFWTYARVKGGGRVTAAAPLGHATARLADGTRIRWRAGEWSVSAEREVDFRQLSPSDGGALS